MKKLLKVYFMLIAIMFCTISSQKVYASNISEKESNNSVTTANAINSGDTVNGSITEDDEYDYYRITLQAASLVQIDFTSWMKNYCVQIYDIEGEEIWYTDGNRWNTTVGYQKGTHKIYLEKGTYYLKISGYYSHEGYGNATGRYTFNILVNDTYRNNYEPDDIFAQANTVNLGTELKGQISENDKLDLWSFQLSASGRVKLDITSYMKYYCLRIYGSDGTEIWGTEYNEWNEYAGYRRDIYSIDLEKGIYYLEVNGYKYRDYDKSTGIYNISTSFEASGAVNSEPDNSFAQANRITLGGAYKGQIAENDEFDTYYISMPASGRIQVDITSWMKYYSISFFDINGNGVCYIYNKEWNDNVGYRTDKYIVELVPGNYYIQINGWQYSTWGEKGTGIYQFKVSEKGASRVNYVLSGGTNGSNPATIDGTGAALKDAKRKGYYFMGWYTDRNFQNRIYNLPEESDDDITVYARWEKVQVYKPKIYSAYNKKGRKIYLYYGGSSYAEGYEITYAYNKSLTSSKKVVRTKATSRTLKKLKRKKTVYLRVRAFKYDSAGSRVYSKYSGRKKVKIRY